MYELIDRWLCMVMTYSNNMTLSAYRWCAAGIICSNEQSAACGSPITVISALNCCCMQLVGLVHIAAASACWPMITTAAVCFEVVVVDVVYNHTPLVVTTLTRQVVTVAFPDQWPIRSPVNHHRVIYRPTFTMTYTINYVSLSYNKPVVQ